MADKTRDIEEMLSHQEQQIQDLSDMVAQQWHEIDLLKKALRALQQKLIVTAQAGDGLDGEALSVSEQALRDKPPHY